MPQLGGLGLAVAFAGSGSGAAGRFTAPLANRAGLTRLAIDVTFCLSGCRRMEGRTA